MTAREIWKSIIDNSWNWIIVGMSLWNTYFSKERLKLILSDLVIQKKLDITMTTLDFDQASLHNFRAIYDSNENALRKRRLTNNALVNKINSALQELFIQNNYLLDWKWVTENNAYQEHKNNVFDLYEKNSDFKNIVKNTASAPIEKLAKLYWKEKVNIDEAIKYLLKELAFFAASPEILWVTSTAFLYHRPFPLFEDYVENKFFSREIIKNVWFIEKSYEKIQEII